jgi:ABC-type Mn2+/Zn2+ transport system permease subunit
MLPLMTTAQIVFTVIAAVMVVAGCWIYFRGGTMRLYPSAAMIMSGLVIENILRGKNLYYVAFCWGIVMLALRQHYVKEKAKLKLSTTENAEQPQPSGN